jgi:hypothetical protein
MMRWNSANVNRVDAPGSEGDLANMDLSTSKEYLQKLETASVATSSSNATKYSDELVEESRVRRKAAKRGRIVLMPLDEPISAINMEQASISPEQETKAE